jgi:hypothetical protein
MISHNTLPQSVHTLHSACIRRPPSRPRLRRQLALIPCSMVAAVCHIRRKAESCNLVLLLVPGASIPFLSKTPPAKFKPPTAVPRTSLCTSILHKLETSLGNESRLFNETLLVSIVSEVLNEGGEGIQHLLFDCHGIISYERWGKICVRGGIGWAGITSCESMSHWRDLTQLPLKDNLSCRNGNILSRK